MSERMAGGTGCERARASARRRLTVSAAGKALAALVSTTSFCARFVPRAVMDPLFGLLGGAVYYAFPGLRRRLREKVAEAMPETSGRPELTRICRGACASLLRPVLDLFLMLEHTDEFMQGLRVEGIENLEGARADGRGVVLVGAHLGANAVRIPVMARLGLPYTALYYHPEDTPVSGYYSRMLLSGMPLASGLDEPCLWAGRGSRSQAVAILRSGGRIGIDFDVDGECVVDFFGRPAALADGIASLALETGAAIVPFMLVRGRGAFGKRVVFFPEIPVVGAGDNGQGHHRIMRDVARAGERMVRMEPGQWESWFGIRYFWERAAEIGAERARAGQAPPVPGALWTGDEPDELSGLAASP